MLLWGQCVYQSQATSFWSQWTNLKFNFLEIFMGFKKLPHTWHPSTMAAQNQLNNQIVVRLVVHGEIVHVDSNILLFPKIKFNSRAPRTVDGTFSASTCVFISPVQLLNQWEMSWPATASIGAISSFPNIGYFLIFSTRWPTTLKINIRSFIILN